MKKILKFLLVILFILPTIGCYGEGDLSGGIIFSLSKNNYEEETKIFYTIGYYEEENTGEIQDGKLDFYVGHIYNAIERKWLFDKKTKKYIYDNISIGVRIDDSEEYIEKIEIPADEFFQSEYYIKTFFVSKEDELPNKKYSYNLKGLPIENKFSVEISYNDYSKEEAYTYTYKNTYIVDIINSNIYLKEYYCAFIRVSLESGDTYVKKYY